MLRFAQAAIPGGGYYWQHLKVATFSLIFDHNPAFYN
jgi:hypothetical protein